jgi:RNA polymerase primary sigma factor
MERDARRLAEELRGLEPMQEKVVRLRYGLGCERAHSASEIARAFRVSREVITGILDAAQARLARVGLTPGQLRAAG